MNKTLLLTITALFCYIVLRPGADSDAAPEFNHGTFQTAISSGKPVVVDFRAKWYRGSNQLAPTIDQLAQESDEIYLVGQLDVERHKDLIREYKVRKYPTVLIFKDGKVVDELDYSLSVREMQNQIFQYL
tara:strand:- start:21245 stop:21634 length:390 start_codon:yes stop_codon:yes gene_type:complete